jgi:hypothetical protein
MELFAQIVLNNIGLLILAAFVLAGYVVVYVGFRHTLDRTVEQLRREWAAEISSLMTASLPKSKAVISVPPSLSAAPISQPLAVQEPVPAAAAKEKTEVAPETLLVIAAAVTAFLGKKVRIRSAKMLYSHESFNAWSQQGRAVVQASHNVAQRVH